MTEGQNGGGARAPERRHDLGGWPCRLLEAIILEVCATALAGLGLMLFHG